VSVGWQTFNGADEDLQGGEANCGEYAPSDALVKLSDKSKIPGSGKILASFITGYSTSSNYGFRFEDQGAFACLACGTHWLSSQHYLMPHCGVPNEPYPIVLWNGEDLANWYTAPYWPLTYNSVKFEDADGIVSVISQRGNAPDNATSSFHGVHGPGTVYGPFWSSSQNSRAWLSTDFLGLNPPHMLQPSSGGPARVVELIDAIDETAFFNLNSSDG
jgi:hypothetical protein